MNDCVKAMTGISNEKLRALGIHMPHGNGFHVFRHAKATLMSSFGEIA